MWRLINIDTFKSYKKLLYKAGVIVATLIIFVVNNGYAEGYYITSGHSFYFGVDAFYSDIRFQKNYGSNMFAKSTRGINVFAAAMLNDALGLEMGYEAEEKRHKSVIINPQEYVAGWLTVRFGSTFLKSEIKQRYPYLGIILNSGINDKCSVSTLLGVSRYNISAKYRIVWPEFGSVGYTATFLKTKYIPTARFSIEYKLISYFAIRSFATWRNTYRVKVVSQENKLGKLIKPKDSFNVGLGVVFYIA